MLAWTFTGGLSAIRTDYFRVARHWAKCHRSARSRSAQRSPTFSIPTLSRSRAGGRCSCPGMLARRSMVDSTEPKLVACWMSSTPAHTASAAAAS